MVISLSCVTAHDKQWPQDTSSSGRRRFKEDTDNILVVTAAPVTSSSISRTSLNKICEIGLHHSEAAPTFYPPAQGCLYCSPMHFLPLAPCWLLYTSRHKPLKAKETFETFFSFLRETTCCTITNALFLMLLIVWGGWMPPVSYYSPVLTEAPVNLEFFMERKNSNQSKFVMAKDTTGDKHSRPHSACVVRCYCLQSQTCKLT